MAETAKKYKIDRKILALHISGNAKLLDSQRKVAVIGSRKASDKALKAAYNIAYSLAKMEYVIVNGLALGVDTEACRGALDCNGQIIVFMPCGRDIIYPRSNKNLYQRILSNGCIASEYEDGTKPEKYRFIERDYLQAKYADHIIVVECAADSGTMHTVRGAYSLGVPIGVIRSNASGNKQIVEKYGGIQISNYSELYEFLHKKKQNSYRQVSMADSVWSAT